MPGSEPSKGQPSRVQASSSTGISASSRASLGADALEQPHRGWARIRDACRHADRPTEPALAQVPGTRLFDINGHRLSIRCTGSGSPTRVLEPGLGESASAMARWIAPAVTGATTVCVYDRAGHGRSDSVPASGADAARDLHVLLKAANAPRPYVLAGHSLGGMFALSYAQR